MDTRRNARERLLWLAVLVGLLLPQPMKAQIGYHETLDVPAWQADFKSCFDVRGNSHVPSLQRFASRVQQARQRIKLTALDDSWLLSLYAYTQAEVGDRTQAQEAYTEIIRRDANVELSESACQQVAGIHAMQGRWTTALYYYSRKIGSQYWHRVGPMIAICLLWMGLWSLGKHVPGNITISRRAVGRLLLMALTPWVLVFLGEILMPLYSWLLTGNAGGYTVSYRADKQVGLLTESVQTMLMLVTAYLIRKRSWFKTATPPNTGTVHAEPISVPRATGRKAVIGRLCFYLLVVLLGLILDNMTRTQSYVPIVQSLPTYWNRVRSVPGFDPVWILDLLLVSVWSPIAQEYLFRGAIYAYARQAGGIGFGIVFNALVFSGSHLDWMRFTALFWVGIIYATQYEITRSLAPPIMSHTVANFLAAVSRVA